MTIDYVDAYLDETRQILDAIDRSKIGAAIRMLGNVKSHGGRVFVLGVGGSAANASHAVNDFRKIASIESYAPSDNVAELTARTNDDGFETVFANWLKTSCLTDSDAVIILSVGGSTQATSLNLVRAMEHAREVGAGIVSIVSRDGGSALKLSDVCILVPVVEEERITPHAESWQVILLHLIVNAVAGSLPT